MHALALPSITYVPLGGGQPGLPSQPPSQNSQDWGFNLGRARQLVPEYDCVCQVVPKHHSHLLPILPLPAS